MKIRITRKAENEAEKQEGIDLGKVFSGEELKRCGRWKGLRRRVEVKGRESGRWINLEAWSYAIVNTKDPARVS